MQLMHDKVGVHCCVSRNGSRFLIMNTAVTSVENGMFRSMDLLPVTAEEDLLMETHVLFSIEVTAVFWL